MNDKLWSLKVSKTITSIKINMLNEILNYCSIIPSWWTSKVIAADWSYCFYCHLLSPTWSLKVSKIIANIKVNMLNKIVNHWSIITSWWTSKAIAADWSYYFYCSRTTSILLLDFFDFSNSVSLIFSMSDFGSFSEINGQFFSVFVPASKTHYDEISRYN